MNETTKRPRCGSEMEKGDRLVSFIEIILTREDDCVGDRIDVYCCIDCGYMELYKWGGDACKQAQNL